MLLCCRLRTEADTMLFSLGHHKEAILRQPEEGLKEMKGGKTHPAASGSRLRLRCGTPRNPLTSTIFLMVYGTGQASRPFMTGVYASRKARLT